MALRLMARIWAQPTEKRKRNFNFLRQERLCEEHTRKDNRGSVWDPLCLRYLFIQLVKSSRLSKVRCIEERSKADTVTFGALFVCLHVCLKLFKAVRIDETPKRNEFR